MTERIVEIGLKKVVKTSDVCTWFDLKRSFEKSRCDKGCMGDNKECRDYSPQIILPSLKKDNDLYNSGRIPDYLL